jgi:hypothetical protein
MKRIVFLLPAFTFAALAQDNAAVQLKEQLQQITSRIDQTKIAIQGAVMGPPMKGAPYSALETIETTQTLADGTHINRRTETMVYRDSEGRIRRETPDAVTIWDPVAGAGYVLDPKAQTARRMPLGVPPGAPFLATARPNGVVMFEYAGSQVVLPADPPPPPRAGNGSIGVAFTPSDTERSRKLLKANGVTEGVFVQEVVPGGPADKAGMQNGDIITGINGKFVRDDKELALAVSALSPGSAVSVSAVRNGKPEAFQTVVADRAKVYPAATAAFDARSFPLLPLQRTAPKTESLGVQFMEGVNAEGTRATQTIEAGEIGNDRPLQIVTERWTSPDLQTTVKMTHSDARTGQETFTLTGISRAEPSADLFQVPPGYQLVK